MVFWVYHFSWFHATVYYFCIGILLACYKDIYFLTLYSLNVIAYVYTYNDDIIATGIKIIYDCIFLTLNNDNIELYVIFCT